MTLHLSYSVDSGIVFGSQLIVDAGNFPRLDGQPEPRAGGLVDSRCIVPRLSSRNRGRARNLTPTIQRRCRRFHGEDVS